jgi:phosphoglycolate phosphatase
MINLIFDYDGTIHDCIKIYKPAFRKAQSYLQEIGLTLPATSADELERWLGFSASEMWASFAPTLPREEREHCSKIIGDEILIPSDTFKPLTKEKLIKNTKKIF